MRFTSAIRLSVRMSWGSERALDMPEGRRLEGATGPADGLGGKRSALPRPAPVIVGARVTVRTNEPRNLFPPRTMEAAA
jgi:hypothetical protein